MATLFFLSVYFLNILWKNPTPGFNLVVELQDWGVSDNSVPPPSPSLIHVVKMQDWSERALSIISLSISLDPALPNPIYSPNVC